MIHLTLHTGPMMSGKTRALGKLLIRAETTGRRYGFLRFYRDNRVRRSIAFARPCFPIHPQDDPDGSITAEGLATTDLIVMDEVQFFAGWACHFLDALATATALQQIDVYAAGLDLKADGTIWPAMPALAERAELQIRHTGRCACGAPATMTLATRPLPPDGIAIGDKGYRPVCRACWQKAQRGSLSGHHKVKEIA